MEGLEQVPLKAIEYRGKTFYELDTDAVLKRRPEWVLVDELAHTNIPGAKHEKRWQSIEELRDAGINVITTVNVQHLESLNDAVFEITGVRVRETVPDWVVDSADEIELVDLTPDAVINRLKRGDIYQGQSIPQALGNFFKKGNIVALRELALRQTAQDVDEQLQALVPTPTRSAAESSPRPRRRLRLAAGRGVQAGPARLPAGEAAGGRPRLPARPNAGEGLRQPAGGAVAGSLRPCPKPRRPGRRAAAATPWRSRSSSTSTRTRRR